MTKEKYEEIVAAGRTLCEYCENDECEKCIVTSLVNDATDEAIHTSIISDDI